MPHPGPGTQGEGSGKAPASLRAFGGIAKPAATALDLATAHRRSLSLGQAKVQTCKHCSTPKRKDHLLNGYCKNQKCQAVAPKPLAPKHITQFFSMAEAHRAVPNAHAPSASAQSPSPLQESYPQPMQVDAPTVPAFNPGANSWYSNTFDTEVFRPMKKQVQKLQSLTETLAAQMANMSFKDSDKGAAQSNADFRTCKTLPEVCTTFGYSMAEEDESIICDLCVGTPQMSTSTKGGAAGRKNGEISLYTCTKVSEGTQRLRTITEITYEIKRHLKSATHQFCQDARAQQEAAAKKVRSAGLAVARQAYLTVCEAKSGLSFERLILNAHMLGVPVGVMNHSDDFYKKFVRSMHKVVVEGIAKFLRTPQEATGMPPPFCIVADKMTALRRTGQMVGILAVVNGRIKAIFAGCLPVTDGHTGAAVAQNLLNALSPYGITPEMWSQQFTGQSYDGQYFHLKAHHAVCAEVGVSHKWAIALHDGGHVLELCMNDCRKSSLQVKPELLHAIGQQYAYWYKNLAKRVGDIQVHYNYGKKYEEVRKIADDLLTRLRAPETYCDTRFAQAERKVYKNYVANWRVVHKLFEDEYATCPKLWKSAQARATIK